MAKKTIKTVAVRVPASQQDAESLLADIGSLQRRLVKIEADMNDALASVKEKFEQLARPLNDAIESKFQSLHIWAEANREQLTKDGKVKTARLATGDLLWRNTPPSVKVQKKLTDAVIAALKQEGLGDLVRVKEEIDKEAILADTSRVAAIKAIKIESREEFVARPFESQIERAEPVKKTVKAA